MGRKIPGKKHRTIKDPYKQRQKHYDSIKSKINNPPTKADEQHIPKSLLRIMELKEKVKQTSVKKPKFQPVVKKTKQKSKQKNKFFLPSVAQVLDKEPIENGMTKPDTFIPKLVQKSNESAESFLRRIDVMTQGLINEVQFEKKFGVEIKKNPETGEILEVKNIIKKHSNSKKKKLNEKRKEKIERKKENLKTVKDFNQLQDKIEFGEVVHRPPSLPAFKKSNEKETKVVKPKYKNLLLNTLIEDKGKNVVSPLEKEKLENERIFIVEAYRKAKKRNSENLKLR